MFNFSLRKVAAAVACLAAFTFGATAGAQNFTKGDNVASGAIGFGGYYSDVLYSEGSSLPVISLYYERGIKDNLWDEKSSIGIGGMLGYTSFDYGGLGGFKTSHTVIGARGALHYQFVDKLDTYTGLFLGYDIVSFKWNDSTWGGTNNAAGSAFDYSWFIGARYYFTGTFAVFGELGVGLAPVNIGVALKF
ncbi:MAG: hypothetical protein LBV41_01375 [Cytophagaceae bacterium]|jgi:hypothetical protein|nr:hypothetical protein [Cytophagaceae bacterium]